MAKPSIALTQSFASISKATISKGIPEEHLNQLLSLLERVGIQPCPRHCNTEDFYSDLIRGIFKPLTVLPGHVTCSVSLKPAVTNIFGGFHGGAIAAVAETVLFATASSQVRSWLRIRSFFLGNKASLTSLLHQRISDS